MPVDDFVLAKYADLVGKGGVRGDSVGRSWAHLLPQLHQSNSDLEKNYLWE